MLIQTQDKQIQTQRKTVKEFVQNNILKTVRGRDAAEKEKRNAEKAAGRVTFDKKQGSELITQHQQKTFLKTAQIIDKIPLIF